MARRTSKFTIGLFVTLGILIGLIAVVWLGASRYFEKGATYATYFDESVQGLQLDSAVKYRGVEIGRVEKIRVAPDNRLIEVIMKINLRGELERDNVAQLKAAGITGIVFVELDRKESDKPDLSPRITFASEYPILSSKPSDIKQLLTGIDNVIQSLNKIDTQGISDQIKSTLKELGSVVASVNGVVGSVEKSLGAGKLEEAVSEAKNTLLKVQNLVSEVQGDLQAMNLGKTGANIENATARLNQVMNSGEIEALLSEVKDAAKRMNQLVEGLDKRSLAITNDIKATSENLKRASESLEMLTERVYASPSDLLFGEPPPRRRGIEKQEK
ncbi:MAG TPA: MlaD family protein [Thermodesulfobacteriota bacterium]|nr:MlaD family protein [Thermodesulfobacteriota bacterium]